MQLVKKEEHLLQRNLEVLMARNVIVINFVLIQTAQENVSNKDNTHTATSHRTKILATGWD
jgi:hypothetical protein